jgi:hypothetical protein
MAKQYKNVYTILEKVKKGEIDAYYKKEDSLFNRISFYKKPDLIKPHLHYIDENRLEHIMDIHLRDQKNIQDGFNAFAKSAEYAKKIPDDKKPDFGKFYEKLKENYTKFPKHILKDIHKMYYHKMENLDFEERTDTNNTKFKFLERANNPVAKIMTEGSNLKSAIFARNLLTYFLTRMTVLDYIDPNASQDMKDGLNGQGDGDAANQAMEDAMDSVQGKNMMDQAMKQSTDLCKEMDNAMDNDLQEQMFENVNKSEKDGGGAEAGKLSPQYIRQVASQLQNIKLSMGSLKDKIKKLLDKSVSYFSARKETIYEDLFNADSVAGLDEFELLHPKLRKIFMEDVTIKETKSVGKIDVYIDISGSMSDNCGISDHRISKLDFCKAMVVKLEKMDMLNDVYLFNNSVKKYRKDPISIAMLDTSGGTDINRAVQKIEQNKVNALVITDAEDCCSTYSDKAFFIGVKGARFNHFHTDTITKYSQAGQVVIFDGKTISRVNNSGYIIK